MFTDQPPPPNMKQSPIYSSLLFIFKHCVKSITAAKPAEATDGSPKDAGGTKRPNVHPVGISLQFTLQPAPA
jgi:hypothetical protein